MLNATLLEYCRKMSMSYSYKPVLILALLENDGKITLTEAAEFFLKFYKGRIRSGKVAERSGSIFNDLTCTIKQARANIRANPVKALTGSCPLFAFHDADDTLEIVPECWNQLTDDDIVLLRAACEYRLQAYYLQLHEKALVTADTIERDMAISETTIENREAYKNVSLLKLDLSTRTYNALRRGGIDSLWSLLNNYEKISTIKNLGSKCAIEIAEKLKMLEKGEIEIETDDQEQVKDDTETGALLEELPLDAEEYIEEEPKPSLPDTFTNRLISDMPFPTRVLTSLQKANINTIGELLALSSDEITLLSGMGVQTRWQLREHITLLREWGEEYFQRVEDGDISAISAKEYSPREMDTALVRALQESYGFQSKWLEEWYGITRSRVGQKLHQRFNHGQWTGKELMPQESEAIAAMVDTESFYMEKEGKKYYLLNNRTDDCALLIVSDENIKCFFLGDLPNDLQSAIREHRLELYTETETKVVGSLGRSVSILKKEYFMPNDAVQFNRLAAARRMTNETYSQFLLGKPYISPSVSVTDERIIETLRQYTVNGVTIVPATADVQWLRNYASRNGYTIRKLVKLFGFDDRSEADEMETITEIREQDGVERDMQSRTVDGDTVEKIFARCPLLGSAPLTDRSIDILGENSKKWVDRVVEDPRIESRVPPKAKMQITLAVISYAKEWDASDESGFWRYIAKQFGYRDENDKVRGFLSNCIRDALLSNQRVFLSNSGGNMYKATIVMHAFSTRRSWMQFCDLLFDFYKSNLNWEYIDGDPLFARMVIAMRNKLMNTADADDNGIKISSKVYNFREGIHKLILFRPRYATKLVAKMVKRIDAIINHTAGAPTCYEDQLCDEWMEEKMRRGSLAASTNQQHEHHAVAIDYTRIRPVYQLENDRDVRIAFPDVRLKDSDFAEITMLMYCKGVLVEQKVCKQYGSELGRTMERFSISLADYLRKSGSDEIDPQVVLRYGAKEIYNSEKTLCREYLIFRNKAETAADSLTQGGYTVVLSGRLQAEFINADVSSVIEESYIKAYFVKLHKDFAVRIGNQIVAVDTAAASSSGARVVFPAATTAARYIEGGTHYRIVSGKEPIHIIMPAEDGAEKRYLLTVNGSAVAFNTLTSDEMEGVKAYTLRLDSFAEDALSVKLLDFANDKLVAAAQFKVIPEIFYKFDKLFYALHEDYDGASVLVTVGNSLRTTCQVTFGDTDISIPYQDGSLEIPVPAVRVYDNANNVWDGSICCWIRDLPQERFLYVKTPAGVSAAILLDGQPVGTAAGDGFALGNAVFGYSNDLRKDWLNVQAKVSSGSEERVIRLGRIAAKEQFLTKPALFTDGHDLRWDLGHSFIGNTQAKLEICICQDTPYERTLRLDLGNDLLAADIDIPIGEYRFSIQKASENLFSTAKEELETGTFCVGDENELRFLHKVIQIDAITPWGSEKVASVAIDRCYIEDVVYHGIENIPAEDGECPVYTGTLVYPLEDGKKYIYSSEERENKRGQLLYKVNPVKIIYLNQNALSITNEDDDGLYYVKYLRKIDQFAKRAAYQITDREPTKETEKHYFNADLYLYTRKGKDDV